MIEIVNVIKSLLLLFIVSYINILMWYKSFGSGKRWYYVGIWPHIYCAMHAI